MRKIITISTTPRIPTLVRERLLETEWIIVHLSDASSLLHFEMNADALLWYTDILEANQVRTAQNMLKQASNISFLLFIAKPTPFAQEMAAKHPTVFRVLGHSDSEIAVIESFLESVQHRNQLVNTHAIEIYPNLHFHSDLHCLIHHGHAIPLPCKEYELLLFLIENRTRFVTIEEILHSVWDPYTSPETARQCIYKLRKKLHARPTDRSLLIYRKGIGYILFGHGTQVLEGQPSLD